jgi:SAM-dependent methyltransferase
MSGFSPDWLAQREPLDAAARDAGLAHEFAAAIAHTPRRIIDLGAGTGANLRLLAPLIGGDQDWLLIDNDPALLMAQQHEIARWAAQHGWGLSDATNGAVELCVGPARWRVRSQQLDLQASLEQIALPDCDGLTTTAFLDLVSLDWIDRLCRMLSRSPRPFLATLSVDGQRRWQPAMADDLRLHQAFEHHQRGDKGFGDALGIAAVDELAMRLDRLGFTVGTARSDWQISGEHSTLLGQMIDEALAVGCELEPDAASVFTDWAARRHSQVAVGALALTIGHRDLLALPGPGRVR